MRLLAIMVMAHLLSFGLSYSGGNEDFLERVKQNWKRCREQEKDITWTQRDKQTFFSSGYGEITVSAVSKCFVKGEKIRVEARAWTGGRGRAEEASVATIICGNDKNVMIRPKGEKEYLEGCQDYIKFEITEDWLDGAKVIGSEKIDGRMVFVLSLDDGDYLFKYWIDPVNHNLIKVQALDDDGAIYTMRFSNFVKASDCCDWPMIIDYYQREEGKGRITIESLEINKGISDDLFNVDNMD